LLHSEEVSTEESRLITAVIERDRKATAEFVATHSDAVYNYLRRRLFPRMDVAEDLLQEVFLDALKGLGTFRQESGLRAWLLGIARHKLQDYYRRRLREDWIASEADEPLVEERFDDWLDEQNLSARVEQTLGALPEAYRVVLMWRYWEKVSAAEMAARTGKTEKAVERMLARAREQFRRRWYAE
jgi:RNA polymerase sigma-70 factor (ECF subfamily)